MSLAEKPNVDSPKQIAAALMALTASVPDTVDIFAFDMKVLTNEVLSAFGVLRTRLVTLAQHLTGHMSL